MNSEQAKWLGEQQWYQIIELSDGSVTPGKYDTRKRLHYFDGIDLKGKTFLDVGCNSGAYCLWAKKSGAEKVVGVDINTKRLQQAKKLAEIEDLEIEFSETGIDQIGKHGKYDVVFCIAVLTEIQDILGAFDRLKEVIGKEAYIELALAKPLGYLSRSKFWFRSLFKLGARSLFEMRETNAGYMLCPSIQALRNYFGSSYEIEILGSGVRYDMLKIVKK